MEKIDMHSNEEDLNYLSLPEDSHLRRHALYRLSLLQHFCPCGSGKSYKECCHVFHSGIPSKRAVDLMRARFTAYALGLSEYIMQTTHPLNAAFTKDKVLWKSAIEAFSQATTFHQLQVLKFNEGKMTATVTFKASLFQDEKDVSFIEESFFEKKDGQWLYREALSFKKPSSCI